MSWILVFGTVLGLVAGQVLFKLGAMHLNENARDGVLAWFNMPLIVAVIVYAVCTIMWIAALRTLPLRVAYPLVALCYILVPIAGRIFLREPITPQAIIGGLVIILGVIIASWSN